MRIPFLGGLGLPELIIILVIVLLIFGPKYLPKLGNAMGRTIKGIREGLGGSKAKDEPTNDLSMVPAEESKENS